MLKLEQSWLAKEKARPLCIMRRRALELLDKHKENNEEPPEKFLEALCSELPDGSAALPASSAWLQGNPSKMIASTAETQIVWGLALLLNSQRPKKEQSDESHIIRASERLHREQMLMGSLLLATIKEKSTTIGYGKSGSWFFHSPSNKRINMDPGMSLLMGLQNARSILLHEIGHAQITLGPTEKMKNLRDELQNLVKTNSAGRKIIPKEKIPLARKIHLELASRENLWQYTEDAAVNTYAEIEGGGFPNDIQIAILRCYATTLLSREDAGKRKENSLPNQIANALQKLILNSEDGEKLDKINQANKTISEKLKAAACAFPISRGWMHLDSPEEWTDIGSSIEYLPISQKLADRKNLEAIGNTQPILLAKRFQIANQTLIAELTAECQARRNQLCDEIFDQEILPLLQDIPAIDPPMQGIEIKAPDSSQDPSEPSELSETPDGTGFTTLEDAHEEHQNQIKEEEHKNAAKQKNANELKKEAKRFNVARSPLTELPKNVTSYRDALEKCQPQIKLAEKTLKAIAMQQRQDSKPLPCLLPEDDAETFDLDTYIVAKEKVQAGERTTEEDWLIFRRKEDKKKPATTILGLMLDGSGSMAGEKAKAAMLTLIILHEAAKRVPHTKVCAVYTGEDKTHGLLTGDTPTPDEEAIIATILQEGIARGDNEICPVGLAELTTLMAATTAKTKNKIGMHHVLFISDGHVAQCQQKQIRKALEVTLDNNPKATFDSVILGEDETTFHQVIKEIKPKRSSQTPSIVSTQTDGSNICLLAFQQLCGRIKQHRSLSPERGSAAKSKLLKTGRRLHELTI